MTATATGVTIRVLERDGQKPELIVALAR